MPSSLYDLTRDSNLMDVITPLKWFIDNWFATHKIRFLIFLSIIKLLLDPLFLYMVSFLCICG